jgi:hypothetical protein
VELGHPRAYTSSPVAIITALEERRRELGLTGQQVSLRMAVRPDKVRLFETYMQKPSPRELQDWAGVLGCKLTLVPVNAAIDAEHRCR